MSIIRKINSHFEEYLASALLVLMTLLIFYQILSRFIFNVSLAWSEETARYAFIWLIYISAALAVKKKEHIRVEIGLYFFKGIAKEIAYLVGDLIFLAFSILLLKDGAFLVKTIAGHGQLSPAVGYSMQYIYTIIPFGYGLMAIRLIQNISLRCIKLAKGERS